MQCSRLFLIGVGNVGYRLSYGTVLTKHHSINILLFYSMDLLHLKIIQKIQLNTANVHQEALFRKCIQTNRQDFTNTKRSFNALCQFLTTVVECGARKTSNPYSLGRCDTFYGVHWFTPLLAEIVAGFLYYIAINLTCFDCGIYL